MGRQAEADAIASSAKPPMRKPATTSSPTFNAVTPGPISATTPAPSMPGEKGSSGLN